MQGHLDAAAFDVLNRWRCHASCACVPQAVRGCNKVQPPVSQSEAVPGSWTSEVSADVNEEDGSSHTQKVAIYELSLVSSLGL